MLQTRFLKSIRSMATMTMTVLVAGAVPVLAQTLPAEPIMLQPHRIAYEVSLAPRSGAQSFTAARGLMVLEFTGNGCDGYATNFRQVVDLVNSDGQAQTMDFRVQLHEEAEGRSFRFTMLNRMQNRVIRDADGEAKRDRDGSISVRMRKPAGQRSDFDGDALFPSALSIEMIRAALGGERSYRARLFDGADGGQKVFDVVATIGPRLEGERNARLEPVLRHHSLDQQLRWPVSMAYFEDGPGDRVPVYTMRSVTFANGVLGDIVFEFPEFALSAKAVRYEALKAETCTR
jgi:hypothetical protein